MCDFLALSEMCHFADSVLTSSIPYYYIQLCTGRGQGNPRWQIPSKGLPAEDLEPNPVVQGVKLIMVFVKNNDIVALCLLSLPSDDLFCLISVGS